VTTGPAARRPNYWEYLRLSDLLALQGGFEDDASKVSNHETLFIIVHQVDELWFKLAIGEVTFARDVLRLDPVPDQQLSLAVASLRRVREIFNQAAHHFRLVETLTTRDFLDFRDKLTPASGFESAQLRALEVRFGLTDEDRVHLGREGGWLDALRAQGGAATPGSQLVDAARADRPTLREAVDAWLWRTPIRGSSPTTPGDDAAVAAFVEDFLAAHRAEIGDFAARAARQATAPADRAALERRYAAEVESTRRFLHADDVAEGEERARRRRIRAALVFIESYRELPLLAWPRELCDTIVSLEQAFVIFRQRHARMVEREIGRRVGTGGSAGVDYLDETALRYRVFRDFWAVRTILVRRDAAPPLEGAERYDFRFGA
jgi:tryptophan 2,3-dioxygenase